MPRLQAQSTDYLAAFFHASPEAVAHPFFSHLPRWDVTAKAKQFYSDDLTNTLSQRDAVKDLEVLAAGGVFRLGLFSTRGIPGDDGAVAGLHPGFSRRPYGDGQRGGGPLPDVGPPRL